METFSDDPAFRIRLHELTRHDIRRFALVMFEKHANFERMSESYSHLVEDIVNMANGVFLWARLVVRSILDGVGHRYSHSALQAKLDATPKDLNALFDTLLSRIDPSDREKSDKVLLLATF